MRLEDTPQLLAWGPQPVKELGSDLADIASMRWPAETLVSHGITYSDLGGAGADGRDHAPDRSRNAAGVGAAGLQVFARGKDPCTHALEDLRHEQVGRAQVPGMKLCVSAWL